MALNPSKLMPSTYAPEREPRVIGYLRIHDSETEPEAQEALLGTAEVLFIDAASRVNASQQQLHAMLTDARRGDVLRVATLDRLGLTIIDAINTLKLLTGMGIEVQFGDQRLVCQPTSRERSPVEEAGLDRVHPHPRRRPSVPRCRDHRYTGHRRRGAGEVRALHREP